MRVGRGISVGEGAVNVIFRGLGNGGVGDTRPTGVGGGEGAEEVVDEDVGDALRVLRVGGDGGLEEFGEFEVGHEYGGDGVREGVGLHVAALAVEGALGDFRGEGGLALGGDAHGEQVGIREVAVVVGVFLGAQEVVAAFGGVPSAGLLGDGAAGGDFADLAGDFVLDAGADAGDGIEILHLGARAVLVAGLADGDIHIAAHLTLFHVAVGDAGLREHHAQGVEEGDGLVGGTQVGRGDDLEERGAGAVVVDEGAGAGVGEFADILLEVGVVEADVFVLAHDIARGAGELDLDASAEGDGVVRELGNLIVLGAVRVEVVFAHPVGGVGHASADEEGETHGLLDGFLVEHGERAGEAEHDGVDATVRAGVGAETQFARGGVALKSGGRRGEDFGGGLELDMDFQTDDGFEAGGEVGHAKGKDAKGF